MSAATEHVHEPHSDPPHTDDLEMAGGLGVTETAAAKIQEIREAEAIEGSYALRVKVMGGGCSGFQYDLYFDEPAEVVHEPAHLQVMLVSSNRDHVHHDVLPPATIGSSTATSLRSHQVPD